jgi:hypothetical protein
MRAAPCQCSQLLDSDSNEKQTPSSLAEQDTVNEHQNVKKESRVCRSITSNHGLGEAVIRHEERQPDGRVLDSCLSRINEAYG